MTAEELAAWQAAHPEQQGEGEEVAIGEDANADEYSDTDPSALTEFKPVLDGHGEWVNDSTYGTVWVPASSEVGTDFQPYVTAGHWTYSDDTDYVWVSDYSWGWAPFHYGRWVVVPNHGWVWIPGRRYAGAWVTWRYGVGYDYIGWAPAPPDYYWYNGYAVGWSFGFYHYYDHYAYCHHDHFFYGGGPRQYVVTGPAAQVHYARTVEYAPPAQRVAASPTVNPQGQRVAAHPTVARPGPKPDTLGMGKDAVVAPPQNHGGLDRARTFAQPSTAVAAGARAPLHTASLNGGSRAPASAASIPARNAPSFHASNPSVGAGPSAGSRSSFGSPSSNQLGGARAAAAQPSFRPSTPSGGGQPYRSQPTFRPSAPSVSSSPSAPSVSRSTPSFRPSAPSVQHAPTMRPSAPSVSHAPSISASRMSPSFRPSSPSVQHAPSGGGGNHRSAAPSVRRR
jgi:hypothetical protein